MRASRVGPDAATRAEQTYDAFISYPHEDADSAEWLQELLAGVWVPGHPKRRIFLDRSSVTADELTPQIVEALKRSRYLIVLCSAHTPDSKWVDLEIREFLKRRVEQTDPSRKPAESYILSCHVGAGRALEYAACRPAALVEVEARRAGPFHRPDLRGALASLKGHSRKEKRDAALALLAPLVGLATKDDLVAKRGDAERLLAAAAVLLLALAGLYTGARSWWRGTPAYARERAISAVLEVADKEQLDEESVVHFLRVLGEEERPDDFARARHLMGSEPLRNIAEATVFAALPQPACDDARARLKSVDTYWWRTWPSVAQFVSRRCADPSLLEASVPPELDSNDALRWLQRLAEGGGRPSPQALAMRDRVAPDRRWLAEQWLRLMFLANGEPAGTEPPDVPEECSSPDEFVDAGDLLQEADRRGLLRAGTFDAAVAIEGDCAARTNPKLGFAWTWMARAAAHSAAAGRLDEARQLLRELEPGRARRRDNQDWADGWAWQALTEHRLGNASAAAALFAAARMAQSTLTSASHSWKEAYGLTSALALAGRWNEAFEVVATDVRDQRMRVLLRLPLVTLWRLQHQGERWPEGAAPLLTRLL